MKLIKICKLSECNNNVKAKRDSFCSQECYWKSLIGNTINNGRIRSEETKQKNREARLGKKQSEEAKKKQIEAQMGHIITEETRRKIAESNKGKQMSETAKQKMREAKKGKYIGENNPNWSGETSFEEYPQEFNKQLKQSVLERDNYTCQNPNCKKLHNKLHVHHIDFNKKNNNPENLITLCSSCHTQINGRNHRDYWIECYQTIMINRIMECLL